MNYVLALTAALLLNATANLLMKAGMKPVDAAGGLMRDGLLGAVRTVGTSGTLIVGLSCFALNAAFYMIALQRLKISIAYPVMVGGGYALIALVARFHPALGERLSLGQILGVGLILTGIVVIAAQTNADTLASRV